MSEAPLEFADLHKEFKIGVRLKRVHAVRGVSLRVEPGEIFGYLGPNGAGKTTTMKMAMGLIAPTSGTIKLFGRSVEDQAVRRRIGYLPEHPYFYDYLTAWELLDFYGRLFGLARAERRARAERLIEMVGLGHTKGRTLRRFSKGMLQRAGIAQALMGDPDLIVLDEPLSGLDPMGRKEVRDVIVSLREQGKTVFFSTHILHDIESVCDRVAIIHQGQILKVGKLQDLLEEGGGRAEVVAKGVVAQAARALGDLGASVERAGEVATVRVPMEGLNAVLRVLIDAEAHVMEVTRGRQSLEELFVREAGGGVSATGGAGAGGTAGG